MKSKITSAVMAALSLYAITAEAQPIALADGSTAIVLAQKGRFISHIEETKPDADGKRVLIPGQVFDGVRLVKKSDGQCLVVRQHLVSLKTVSSGDSYIQLPTITGGWKSASCNPSEIADASNS